MSILSKIVDKTRELDTAPLTTNELDELKKAILDRVGCCIGARRLALGGELSKHVQDLQCSGHAAVWGTGYRTQPHLAAMINGAMSSVAT